MKGTALAAVLLAGAGAAVAVSVAGTQSAAITAAVPPSAAGTASRTLVVCAPGFPGDTESAGPTMDAFARAAIEAAEWPGGSLGVVYHSTEQGGLDRLSGDDVALAIVPVPFFLQSGERLGLKPALQIETVTGTEEVWSLAARRGAVASAAALDGWEITGRPGYAPAFVRGPILGEWGVLPDGARITATSSVLGALRRAAAGEKLVVLLDAAQTGSLSALPFAQDLEVVTRSGRLPGGVLCTVGDRLPAGEADAFLQGLLRLHRSQAGKEALVAMRLKRFHKLDEKALEATRRSYLAAREKTPDRAR